MNTAFRKVFSRSKILKEKSWSIFFFRMGGWLVLENPCFFRLLKKDCSEVFLMTVYKWFSWEKISSEERYRTNIVKRFSEH